MRTPLPALSALSLALLMGTPAFGLDLNEAYQKARENDPNWLSARNTYLADSREDAVGLGGLLPSVVANGSVSQNTFDADTGSSVDYDATQWAIKATQPLFRPDAWFNYQRSRASASAAEASYRSQEQALALRVSQAYFGVLSAQETLAYAQSEEAAFGRQLDQAQQRFDVGLIAITDVLEARASFDSSRANRIAAEAALQAAQENLAVVIGEGPGKLVPLKADAPMIKPVPADPESWVGLARERNPDLLVAQENAKVARSASRQAKSGLLPTVDLYGSYSSLDRSNISPAASAFAANMAAQNGTTTSVGLEANWVLFAGGRTYNASKQASYRAAAAQDAATGTEKQVVNSTRTAFNNVSADSYRVEARKQAVASSEASLDATQAGYEVGTRNIVDVLLAQRNMYAAKRDYAAARYDYVLNSLRLKAASGQLSEVDIRELNAWLDPNASVISAPDRTEEAPAAPATTPAPAKKKR